MDIREKVQLQLGRVEEETKRLTMIREELEALADPMRKEVVIEREYEEAPEVFNDKKKEKVQLLTKLMELVSESEKLRMNKLEELSKNINSIH
ncbi:uncharacterized protein LOC120208619 [Hibiscus syriacus]|uniref:uncharacterized protein LOC120208619 n=1 Tax=Hibiscus syriacus TaxID=106335 RepID=UPI0019248DB8|nr:uncharacterized protein LOC120208619 [Hibiscus syriacus]